jgi:hypothetical protein
LIINIKKYLFIIFIYIAPPITPPKPNHNEEKDKNETTSKSIVSVTESLNNEKPSAIFVCGLSKSEESRITSELFSELAHVPGFNYHLGSP